MIGTNDCPVEALKVVVRRWRGNLRGWAVKVRQELMAAAMTALVAGVAGPLVVALVPGMSAVAGGFLPAGPERLLITGVFSALAAEVVRVHIQKFRLVGRVRKEQGHVR